MRVIVDIPDEEYKTLSNMSEKEKVNELSYYERIIANGIPLPKGHGDLIDRNYFIDKYAGCGSVYCEDISCNDCNSRIINKLDVDSAPAIISSDNSEVG